MNLLRLSLAYIRARALNAALNVLLLGLGVATIVVLLLFTHQLEQRLERDSKGIDLVVGAKGSPLQLILSSVYHVDIPTGNIPLADAEKLKSNPLIKDTVPLALGDSFEGFRIVGTDHDYVSLYQGQVTSGRLWEKPYEAVLGNEVASHSGLKLGEQFVGSHGLVEGGEKHEHSPYTIVGVLAPSGSVLDRLVLTSVESVWEIHGQGPHAEEDDDEDSADPQQAQAPSATRADRGLGAVRISDGGGHAAAPDQQLNPPCKPPLLLSSRPGCSISSVSAYKPYKRSR